MSKMLHTLPLLVCLMGLSAMGCEKRQQTPESSRLMDLDSPTSAADEALRSDSEPQPLPQELSFQADPEDPRTAARLEDLDVREEPAAAMKDAPADQPMPLPEEPQSPGS